MAFKFDTVGTRLAEIFFPAKQHYIRENILSSWGIYRVVREINAEHRQAKAYQERKAAEGPSAERAEPVSIFKKKNIIPFFRILTVFCLTIALLSASISLCVKSLEARRVHQCIEFICLPIPIVVAAGREAVILVNKAKERTQQKIAKGVGKGYEIGVRGVRAAYYQEVAFSILKALLYSGFFVAAGLCFANLISLKELGIISAALCGGVFIVPTIVRQMMNFSELYYKHQINKIRDSMREAGNQDLVAPPESGNESD